MPILAERGYLIPAVNTHDVNYVDCAVSLAQSIRKFHPGANIALLTDQDPAHDIFDHVVMLPHGNKQGYANDWQAFSATPYRQTIKLEADMILCSPFDHWWTLFEKRDVVVSVGCRNWKDEHSSSRYYRRFIDSNHLPDVYSAITYWRHSKTARDFSVMVRDIFENWQQYRTLVKFSDDLPSTDFVYAMAAAIMGTAQVTLPAGIGPNIIHMKQHIAGIQGLDWTRELVWEKDPVRIQTLAQWGMLHYHIKDWHCERNN